jgi:prophage antirepressor-like protein
MSEIEKIRLFDNQKVRTIWVEEEEEWYFSVKDVVTILTETANAKDYISKMRRRDEELSKGWGQIVHPLTIQTAGGPQKENCATLEGIFRIIQSTPSKKAEPFKVWMASVAAERINQMVDPERSIDQAMADYRRLGYSESWITRRIKTIEIRKGLTDEWKRGGITKEIDFAMLTDLMSKTWSGLTTREYKKHKGLTKENLRDNMTNMELLLNALAEETATEISKERNPQGLTENARIAKEGADVAKAAREDVEKRLGRSVVSSEKAVDYIQSPEELPFEKPDEQ